MDDCKLSKLFYNPQLSNSYEGITLNHYKDPY